MTERKLPPGVEVRDATDAEQQEALDRALAQRLPHRATALLRDYVPPETVPREAMDLCDLAAQRLVAMGKVATPEGFDEAPTVVAARPAAAALIAEHVEENLRLHARVNELEASIVRAPSTGQIDLHAMLAKAEARVRELEDKRFGLDEANKHLLERALRAERGEAAAQRRVEELEAHLQHTCGERPS